MVVVVVVVHGGGGGGGACQTHFIYFSFIKTHTQTRAASAFLIRAKEQPKTLEVLVLSQSTRRPKCKYDPITSARMLPVFAITIRQKQREREKEKEKERERETEKERERERERQRDTETQRDKGGDRKPDKSPDTRTPCAASVPGRR